MINWIYLNAQFSVNLLFLAVLYIWRNEIFYFVRNMYFVAMGLALVVHLGFPVAPPRLFPRVRLRRHGPALRAHRPGRRRDLPVRQPVRGRPEHAHVLLAARRRNDDPPDQAPAWLRVLGGLYPLVVLFAIVSHRQPFPLRRGRPAPWWPSSRPLVADRVMARCARSAWAWGQAGPTGDPSRAGLEGSRTPAVEPGRASAQRLRRQAQAPPLELVEHEGQRGDRPPPRSGRAVVVGVVREQHRPLAEPRAGEQAGDRRGRGAGLPVAAPVGPQQRAPAVGAGDRQRGGVEDAVRRPVELDRRRPSRPRSAPAPGRCRRGRRPDRAAGGCGGGRSAIRSGVRRRRSRAASPGLRATCSPTRKNVARTAAGGQQLEHGRRALPGGARRRRSGRRRDRSSVRSAMPSRAQQVGSWRPSAFAGRPGRPDPAGDSRRPTPRRRGDQRSASGRTGAPCRHRSCRPLGRPRAGVSRSAWRRVRRAGARRPARPRSGRARPCEPAEPSKRDHDDVAGAQRTASARARSS